MKKTAIYFIASFSILLSSSCSDYLDQKPDSMLTLEMVFNDPKKTNEWLANIYNNVQDPAYRDICNIGLMSDDFQASLELVQFGWGAILAAQQGSWTSETGLVNYWEDTYKAIRTAYIFLENVKPLPDQGLTEREVEYMKCEVRFLICHFYFYLLQLYGPVPLVTEIFSSQTATDDLLMQRTPLDQIAEWMDKELSETAISLPEKLESENVNFGRVTKGACLALRARMWTWMASPLFNGNPYFADLKNPDGTSLFPTTYDAAKWAKAAAANKEVIDLASKGIYSLYKEYAESGKSDPFLSFMNAFITSGEVNKEIIWSRADFEKGNMEYFFNPRSNGSYGSYSVTQNLVDEYRMMDGKDITDNTSGYREDDFTQEDMYYPDTKWNYSDYDRTTGLILPKGSFNMWYNREPRFYSTIRWHKSYVIGLEGPCEYAMGQKDGRPSHDTPATGYHGRKGLDPTATPRTGNTGVYRPAIIFRLAEFYLNYAEALVESDPRNPDILVYVNYIRERGGLPDLPADLIGNQEELRKQVRKEQRIEFAMEGKFRYDYIRRWKIAVDLFKTPIQGMNQYGEDTQPVGADNSFYKRVDVLKRVFEEKMYLWPIRQSFLDKNKNLVQNKGW